MEGDPPQNNISIAFQFISIHSLRMEGDGIPPKKRIISADISIHSLRMEGDQTNARQRTATKYFNPLPPHGGRRAESVRNSQPAKFQSTPSAWRETKADTSPEIFQIVFQSTPSAWRETASSRAISVSRYDFNPLPPHGGRQILYL